MPNATPAQLTRQAYRFAATVPAGATVRLTERIPRDGTVESVKVRIYVGAQLALQVKPYVTNERQFDRPLVYYAPAPAKQFIDGDDDRFEWHIREPVAVDDYLVVEITNTDATNSYDASVDMEVDYLGGLWPSR
jgi:hypothetical protein